MSGHQDDPRADRSRPGVSYPPVAVSWRDFGDEDRGTLQVVGLRPGSVSHRGTGFVHGLGTGVLHLRLLSDDDGGDDQRSGNEGHKMVFHIFGSAVLFSL